MTGARAVAQLVVAATLSSLVTIVATQRPDPQPGTVQWPAGQGPATTCWYESVNGPLTLWRYAAVDPAWVATVCSTDATPTPDDELLVDPARLEHCPRPWDPGTTLSCATPADDGWLPDNEHDEATTQGGSK